MTAFDIVFVLIVIVSALVGYARGAIKELVTLFAFLLAALAAVFALPVSGALFRKLVHPAWAGNALAVLVVFVLVYIVLRVIGGLLTRHVHSSSLGGIDRGAGAVFGVGRALVLVGAFFLVFNAVTPAELSPRWISGGFTWPVARASGHTLTVFAPGGMKLADGVTRMMGEGVKKGFNETDDSGGIELGGSKPDDATESEAREERRATTKRAERRER